MLHLQSQQSAEKDKGSQKGLGVHKNKLSQSRQYVKVAALAAEFLSWCMLEHTLLRVPSLERCTKKYVLVVIRF